MPEQPAAVRTLKIVLAYDGTDFVGWQRQADGASIQGALEDALSRIEGSRVTVTGAGRTDAGVHASAQVASVSVDTRLDGITLRRALNAILPHAVRVLAIEDAPAGFHARFDAVSKTYHYRIVNGPLVSPFERRWAWHIPWPLDVARMQDAAQMIEGEHDFAAFQSTGSHVARTVRRVTASAIVALDRGGLEEPGLAPSVGPGGGRMIVYVVTASGFLRHMVRAIVGTLVEIGSGRGEPARIRELMAGAPRSAAGATAPACGLCLAQVTHAPRRLRLNGKSQ